MLPATTSTRRLSTASAQETRHTLPAELTRLLAAGDAEVDDAWTEFLITYSRVLLEAAAATAPGYDDTLDRYTYILDELRRHNCQRLRRFAADGRGRFSTWLSVVAKRLSVDHYRHRYGRLRRGSVAGRTLPVTARRRLRDLSGSGQELELLEDPAFVDPVDALDASERRAALAQALAILAPEDRLLLRLRYEENLTAREIAARLGLQTPFHVYRRLNAVCERLRSELEGVSTASEG